jgi:hypothetical protein
MFLAASAILACEVEVKIGQQCLILLHELGLPCHRRAQGSLNRGRTADGGSWLESGSVRLYIYQREKNPSLTIGPHSRSGRGGEERNPFQYLVTHYTQYFRWKHMLVFF